MIWSPVVTPAFTGQCVCLCTRVYVSGRQTGELGQYESEVASLRQQLDQLLGRQRQLEEDNSRLQVTPDQVKRALLHLTVSEARYRQLTEMDADTMSINDFAAVSERWRHPESSQISYPWLWGTINFYPIAFSEFV